MKRKTLFIFSAGFLLFFPMLFWGSLYLVGGDDSKLYYVFPYQYFEGFTLKFISDNALGIMGNYFPQQTISGFSLFVYLIKLLFPHLNTQLILFGCNLSLSFIFFYVFLGLWIPSFKQSDYIIKLLASFAYVFSNFAIYSLWQTQLFSLYLTAIFPLSLYLFIRGVRESQLKFVVLNAVLLSVFSIVFLSIPWLAALILVTLPLLVCVFIRHKMAFLIHGGLLVIALVFLNIYWIPHALYSSFGSNQKTGLISNVVSQDFRSENRTVIRGVSEHNSLLYPMLGLYHKRIQEDYVWHTLPVYKKFSLPLLSFNLIFVFVLLGGLFFQKKMETPSRSILLAAFVGWLIALYFFTVQIGSWGTNLFLQMNDLVPGFTMFRNMFDKFGLALGFGSAFVLAMSLKALFDNVGVAARRACMALLTVAIFANAYPFIVGKFSTEKPLWTTDSVFMAMTDFNPDFYALLDYLRSTREPSRFIWLPWQNTNYIEVQDKSLKDYFYIGVSPLTFLAGVSDFTGRLGLPTLMGNEIVRGLYDHDYAAVADIFRKLNGEYYIVKNEIPQEIAQSYLYGGEKGGLFDLQGNDFRNLLLGEKIRDFGERYSLYRVNGRFANEKIYLTDDLNRFPDDFSQVSFQKKASHEYVIHIRKLRGVKKLVFLDPYYEQWELLLPDRTKFLSGAHEVVFDYANGWSIDADQIRENFPAGFYKTNGDGSIDLDLVLYFRPQQFLIIGLIISGIAFGCCLAYLGYGALVSFFGKRGRKT